jgi:hypothetical protein
VHSGKALSRARSFLFARRIAAAMTGAANRLLATLLFGVRPTDPATAGAVILTMLLVAATACCAPAWRGAGRIGNDAEPAHARHLGHVPHDFRAERLRLGR